MYKKFKNRIFELVNYFVITILLLFTLNLTFFSEKSLIKVLEQNEKIFDLGKNLNKLKYHEERLMIKIKSLGENSFDEDLITELGQRKLGLIKENYVLVLLNKQ